jgi:hypothetical protein
MKKNLTIDDLTIEAYENLDKIRILSRLSSFAIVNEADNINEGSFELIFKCIEEYSWQVSEVVETLGNRCAANDYPQETEETTDVIKMENN